MPTSEIFPIPEDTTKYSRCKDVDTNIIVEKLYQCPVLAYILKVRCFGKKVFLAGLVCLARLQTKTEIYIYRMIRAARVLLTTT